MLWDSEGKTKMTEYKPCPKCGKLEHDPLTGYWSLRSDGDMGVRCTLCKEKTTKKVYAAEPPPSPFGKGIDNSDLERYVKEPRLQGNFLLLFDPHFPFHHEGTFQHAKAIAERFKIRKVLIGGDAFELYYFSQFYKDRATGVKDWSEEAERTRCVLEWLAEWASQVHMILGNHELRMWKRLMAAGAQEDIYRIILDGVKPTIRRKFHYYLYPVAVINDSLIVYHPSMSSVIQTRVPERLASKYLPKEMLRWVEEGIQPKNGQMGYISGHGHLGGTGTDASGEFFVADGIVMADPELFNYHVLKRNARPEWRVGFYVLKDNYLLPFPEKHTHWKLWLG